MKYVIERGGLKRTVYHPRRLQIRKQEKLQERNNTKTIARIFIEAFAEYFGEVEKGA